MSADLSPGIADAAEHIYFLVGAWHDFGYEVPPTPQSKPIPPLGERSAAAITAGHEAIEAIDALTRQLYALRDQLITELRQNDDINMARSGALLAGLRAERDKAAAAGVDDELQPVVCLRPISTNVGGIRACLLPVDHEPTSECPGNPHARPAPAEDAAPVYVCPGCGAEDDDEAVIARHMAREHAAEQVSPEDAALLEAVAGALGYQTVTLDGTVAEWTGHGPGCGCPDCEGMRSDAGADQ